MDDEVEIELCGSNEHNITVVYHYKTVLIKLPIYILYGKQFVHFTGKLYANIANASAVNISSDLFINFAVTAHHHHYISERVKSSNNNIIV